MNRILLMIFLNCLTLAIYANGAKFVKRGNSLYQVHDKGKTVINEHVVTVKLKNGVLSLPDSLTVIRKNQLGYIDISVPSEMDVIEFYSKLKGSDLFEVVKLNDFGEGCMIPNDTHESIQWYLNNINVFDAWNITTGNANVKVAVLDTEINWQHPDLGMGNDNYKNIDESLGYNYLYNSQNVVQPHFHGTASAGIIGAKTNNNLGVSGICGGNNSQGVTIIPYCIGGNNNIMDFSVVDDAIINATNKGAKIIQMSFKSFNSNYPDINAAIDYAYNNGVTLIAASGNDSLTNWIGYPASNPKVIAVGASDKNDNRCIFSNCGTGIDLVAPGDSIYTIHLQEGYGYRGGTSFSAPMVSGVVASMLSINPNLTPSQIRSILINTATKPNTYTYDNDGWNNEVGYGVVNAFAAVMEVALRIVGASTIYEGSTFSVENTCEGMSVAWSLSGLNSSCFILEEDVPSANRCRLSRIDGAEFIGSASLTLTAHIIYNGDTIKTLTKQLAAPYIDGPTVPCDHAVYSVVSRPENSTVAWETNGHGLGYDLDPNGLLPEDTTAHVIIPSDGEDIWGTLTANVIVDGDTVGVLSKYIDTSGGFFGTWYQEPTALDSTNAVPQGFAHMSLLGMVSNRKVYLVSDDFIDATITHSQNGVLIRNWSNSNGVISFTPWASIGNGLGMVTVNGSYPNSCKHFRFFLTLPQQPLPPLLLSASPSGGAWQFALSEREGVERSDDSRTALPTDWHLTVIKSDTGRTVYDGHVSGTSATVSTVGWLPGVYVAVAFVDGQYISSKFVVSK